MPADEKTILERKITIAKARLEKLSRENREMEMYIIICDVISGRRKNLDDLPLDLVNDIDKAVTKKRQEVEKRIQELRSMDSSSNSI